MGTGAISAMGGMMSAKRDLHAMYRQMCMQKLPEKIKMAWYRSSCVFGAAMYLSFAFLVRMLGRSSTLWTSGRSSAPSAASGVSGKHRVRSRPIFLYPVAHLSKLFNGQRTRVLRQSFLLWSFP